jgi:hypothetical protein
MGAAVGVRTSVRATTVRIVGTANVSARGKTEERDVAAVNRGRLRHPVFGRRRAPWKTTTVVRGFVDRPINKAGDRITDAVRKARDSVADEIVRG